MAHFKLLFYSLLFFIMISSPANAQWSQAINGMGNEWISALLAEGDTLYASSGFDMFKSTNEGSSWLTINNGLPPIKNFFAIVRSGNNLIAGGDSPGIWLSADNGNSWFQTTNGVDADEYVFSFFIDENIVYAAIGFPSAVGISTDNGITWSKSTNGISSSQFVSGVSKIGSTLFAVHSTLGVHTSTDNGINWELSFTGGIGAQDKNAIIRNGNNLCIAATNGVWTTTDSGKTWNHTLIAGISAGFGTDGSSIYTVGVRPLYRSNDNGITWQLVDDTGLFSSINNTMQFTTNYAFVNTPGIGVFRRPRSEVTSVEIEQPNLLPSHFNLKQNYPNPFNPTTKISYSIPQKSYVFLKVYDILGKEIVTLVNENKPAGNYEVNFDASSLASGIYFYKLQSGNYIETKKMILLK